MSLDVWQTSQSARLDEFENAHKSVGGRDRGRRFATQELNRAYAVLLAAQFQLYCRNLHFECVHALLGSIPSGSLREIAYVNFVAKRAIDRGNARPGTIAEDYTRLGIELWDALGAVDGRNASRKGQLEDLNAWRNAIAYEDFRDTKRFPAGRNTSLRVSKVREWRRTYGALASDMDEAMRRHLVTLIGRKPW